MSNESSGLQNPGFIMTSSHKKLIANPFDNDMHSMTNETNQLLERSMGETNNLTQSHAVGNRPSQSS